MSKRRPPPAGERLSSWPARRLRWQRARRRVEQVGLAAGNEELIAEDLRRAIEALGRVTGEELVPDLLDEIFRRFCIGK